MRFDWLEDFEKQGHITKEAKARIYGNCKGMVEKLATNGEMAKANKTLSDAVAEGFEKAMRNLQKGAPKPIDPRKMIAISAALGAMPFLGMGVAKMFGDARAKGNMDDAIVRNKSIVLSDPQLKDKQKAEARFNEILQYAPAVAANTPLVSRMVKSKLKSGLSDQDVQNLAMMNSMSMKTATVSPEKLGGITADAYIMTNMAAPGLLEKTAIKIKGGKKLPTNLKTYLGTIGAITLLPYLIGAGAGTVSHLIEKNKDSKLKEDLEKSYRHAVEVSKGSKSPAALAIVENRDQARKAFQALAHFAPGVAVQPEAARAFMSKLVSFDQGIMTSDLKDLTDIQRNLNEAGKQPGAFMEGFKGTGQQIGLQNITSKGFQDAADPFIAAAT